jgi:hypothetical protein
MRSRAVVLSLHAGLILLCSATKAQVSVFLLPLKTSTTTKKRSSRCRVGEDLGVSLPRLWRKREGFSLSDLAFYTETCTILSGCRSFEGTASLWRVLRARERTACGRDDFRAMASKKNSPITSFCRDGNGQLATSRASSFVLRYS